MIKQQKNKSTSLTGGFSLFIAVIVIGALLIISFTVTNISVKETSFSTSNRESQYAIFAADTGIECAIYWDAKANPNQSAFATSAPFGTSINCAGNPPIITGSQNPILGTTTISRIGGGGDLNPTSVFGFSLNNGSNPVNSCVIVTVLKDYTGPGNTVPLLTRISSYGYNTCDINNPRRVERGIEVKY